MQLEEAAAQRWGSLEDMEKEKQKRVARKEKRELEKAQESHRGVRSFRDCSCSLECVLVSKGCLAAQQVRRKVN